MTSGFRTPRAGISYDVNSGKLYQFSATRIDVIKAWPKPVAWRRTRTIAWRNVRARIKMPVGDLAGEIRELLSSGEEQGQLRFSFAVQSELKQDLAWLLWFDRIPREVREAIAPFRNRHWHMLSLVARCAGALDLVRSDTSKV